MGTEIAAYEDLLKQLDSIKMENSLLKQKLNILETRCENHKFKYEQMSIECKYSLLQFQTKFKQQHDNHQTQINSLNIINKNQSLTLYAIKQEFITLNKQLMDTKTTQKQETNEYIHNIQTLKQEIVDKNEEIDLLKFEQCLKDIDINALKSKLNAKYENIRHTPYHKSPSTLKRVISVSPSYPNIIIRAKSVSKSKCDHDNNKLIPPRINVSMVSHEYAPNDATFTPFNTPNNDMKDTPNGNVTVTPFICKHID